MRRLMKIEFPCHTLALRPGSGLYVHCDAVGHMSDHETVHSLQCLTRRTSFSLHCPPILRLLKPSQTPEGLLTQIKTSMQSNNAKLSNR
jgi:hypothetical protein